ncbi:hypothetical protein D0862_09429 [Hortaea werneckii]|uniref:Rhodopsin domain-containing protein n=1 Tax=Hortaea werneckii TaxID=91943 RepID=A0A3M7FWC3_HORWE|nr:hypothetical protein D0862_09429 [Hortaea werneckii]
MVDRCTAGWKPFDLPLASLLSRTTSDAAIMASSEDWTGAYSAAGKNDPHENQGPLLVRTCWALIAISIVVVGGRLYAKIYKTRRLYWDDGLMILALIFGIIHAATITEAAHYGLGKHLAYLSDKARSNTMRVGVFTLLWAMISPMFGRMSFLVSLLYLTGTDVRVSRWPIWAFIALQFIINVVAIIVFFTQCGNQLDILWSEDLGNLAKFLTVCKDPMIQTDLGYFQGAFNTLTDAFLTIMPAVLIKHTTLSARAKVDDLSMYVIALSVELNVVIITSSVPFLRPLFERKHNASAQLELMQRQWDTSTVGSVFSKKSGARTNLSRVDSEENSILPDGHHQSTESIQMQQPSGAIQVTQEISVSYETSDVPHVHAALVGLLQGEINNPRLVRK